MASCFVWGCANGKVVDAEKTTTLAKYANNSVVGVYYCNAKIYNEKGESVMKATKKISPGEEIFWNYGKSFFLAHKIDKITKTKLLDGVYGSVLLRERDNGKIGNKAS